MRAALFITRLGDTLFPDVGMATVRILERPCGVPSGPRTVLFVNG